MRPILPHLLAVFALAGFGPHVLAEDRGVEGVEEVAGPLPWTWTDDTVFLRRIVDLARGRPVPGATLRLFAEARHPQPDFGTPLATVASGPDGWVRVRKADIRPIPGETRVEADWAYVEAPGYGVVGTQVDRLDLDILLRPAAEMRVTLRDPLERPVAGALVGCHIGCGHMPDLRQAWTDEHGLAHFDGCAYGSSIWFSKAGLRSDYGAEPWWPWQREVASEASWGITVEGTILRHDGSPEPDVAIGTHALHRGPWTRPDAHGRFRLSGMDGRAGDEVSIEAHGDGLDPTAYRGPPILRPMPPAGFPLVVRLPPPGEVFREPEPSARLVVDVSWPQGVERDDLSVEVTVVREQDGWTAVESVGEQGVALFDVPPGGFHVFAEGFSRGRLPGISAGRGQSAVQVPSEGGAYAVVKLPPVGTLVLDSDIEHATVHLLREGEVSELEIDLAARLHTVLVAGGQSYWLRVGQEGASRLRPIPASFLEPGSPPYLVRPLAKVKVVTRLLDPEGRPARGWLVPEDQVRGDGCPDYPAIPPRGDPSTAPILELREADDIDLVAWPEDTARLQPVRLPRRSIEASAQPVDLGEVRLPPRAPRLTVLGPDGQPLEASVVVTRGTRCEELAFVDGGFLDPWAAPGVLGLGALVRVQAWGQPGGRGEDGEEWRGAFWSELVGEGPWTVGAPKGSLRLELEPIVGVPLVEPVLHIDGGLSSWPAWPARYVGLAAGDHEVVVEAKGMRAQRLRFKLHEGEERRWTIRFRPQDGPR